MSEKKTDLGIQSAAVVYGGAIEQHQGVDTADLSFESLGLSDFVLRCIGEIGFEHPTPIQARVIPLAASGRDVIGLAETGSGKTAAFGLPMVQDLLAVASADSRPRALILAPTREIALQTESFLRTFIGKPRSRRLGEEKPRALQVVCLIGGVRIGPQLDQLSRKPDVLVATPGRLLDHVERRSVTLDAIATLVLDEADHMLDLGFWPQIQKIFSFLPAKRQTMMFSATMPAPIERIAQRFMTEPELVDLSPSGRAAAGIEHRLYLIAERDKKPCALSLLHQEQGSTLVFTRRKTDAEWLCRVLESEGHPAERIHSNRSQNHRVRALEGFREGKHRILVATDIAARGIDVPRIEHIINFDFPQTVEDYVHRAGRTARGSAQGTVSSIATWIDKSRIRDVERTLGHVIPRGQVDGVEPWVERQSLKERRKRSPLRR